MNVSQLAAELAQDRKFRRKLVSALSHVGAAGGRAGGGVRSAADRLTSDRQVLRELRAARDDLQRAYSRARTKKRRRRFRKLLLLAALAAAAALPQVRERLKGLRSKQPPPEEPTTKLESLTKDELYARAQQADIPGRSEMSKDELISALRAKNG